MMKNAGGMKRNARNKTNEMHGRKKLTVIYRCRVCQLMQCPHGRLQPKLVLFVYFGKDSKPLTGWLLESLRHGGNVLGEVHLVLAREVHDLLAPLCRGCQPARVLW
jgi:hypothetical protein